VGIPVKENGNSSEKSAKNHCNNLRRLASLVWATNGHWTEQIKCACASRRLQLHSVGSGKAGCEISAGPQRRCASSPARANVNSLPLRLTEQPPCRCLRRLCILKLIPPPERNYSVGG